MGILDNIAGPVTQGTTGNTQTNIVGEVLGMLGGEQGGLTTLVQKLAGNGLGDIVSSWVGTGANLPVSPNQITQGMGSDLLSQLAGKLGIPQDQVAAQLSNILPAAVDKLTPNGKIEEGDIMSKGMDILKSFL